MNPYVSLYLDFFNRGIAAGMEKRADDWLSQLKGMGGKALNWAQTPEGMATLGGAGVGGAAGAAIDEDSRLRGGLVGALLGGGAGYGGAKGVEAFKQYQANRAIQRIISAGQPGGAMTVGPNQVGGGYTDFLGDGLQMSGGAGGGGEVPAPLLAGSTPQLPGMDDGSNAMTGMGGDPWTDRTRRITADQAANDAKAMGMLSAWNDAIVNAVQKVKGGISSAAKTVKDTGAVIGNAAQGAKQKGKEKMDELNEANRDTGDFSD